MPGWFNVFVTIFRAPFFTALKSFPLRMRCEFPISGSYFVGETGKNNTAKVSEIGARRREIGLVWEIKTFPFWLWNANMAKLSFSQISENHSLVSHCIWYFRSQEVQRQWAKKGNYFFSTCHSHENFRGNCFDFFASTLCQRLSLWILRDLLRIALNF